MCTLLEDNCMRSSVSFISIVNTFLPVLVYLSSDNYMMLSSVFLIFFHFSFFIPVLILQITFCFLSLLTSTSCNFQFPCLSRSFFPLYQRKISHLKWLTGPRELWYLVTAGQNVHFLGKFVCRIFSLLLML